MADDDSSSVPLNPLAPPFLSNPTEDIRSILIRDLKGLSNSDLQSCNNFADLSLYLLKTLHIHDAKIARLESDTRPVQSQIRDLEQMITLLTHENRLLKQQIALVEDASKILSLRVEGLQEKSGENLITYVASTLSRTGVSCSYEDIDYAKRIGKFKQGQTRPILVKFTRESKRNLILYNRANLNRNTNTLVWINDDTSDYTRRQRKTVREIAACAKTQGISDLKIHGDGLILGNDKYKHQDLDLLPTHLSVANAKQIIDENDLYFQSEHSPLSNFYSCPIYDHEDTCFVSAEQLFQFRKATHHDYLLTANKILLTKDPYEIKRLGNLVPTSQTWLQKEESVMTETLQLKFSQNPSLANILIATGDLHLHEATADRKWSTGAELSSKAVLNGIWQGSDLMGSLLEKIRSQLRGDTILNTETLPPHSAPPPLEGDDLLPMPDLDDLHDDNTTLNPPDTASNQPSNTNTTPNPPAIAPNQPSVAITLSQTTPAPSKLYSDAALHNKTPPTYPDNRNPPAHVPSKRAPINTSKVHSAHPQNENAIQPLMQCQTAQPKSPLQANPNTPSSTTRSPPPPRPPPPARSPSSKQQQASLGAKSEKRNPATIDKDSTTSIRAPVRRSSRPTLPTSRFSQQ